jgi:lycopene cyclase domain-containing protein
MKSEYMLVLLGTLLVPLLLSFDRNIALWRNWRALLRSIAAVLLLFGAWDIAATLRGHWSFNPAHVLGTKLAELPIEEWLFFIVVPFVTIFTWESVKYFLRGRGR